MGALRLILADQLTPGITALDDISTDDTVLMCEVLEEASYVPHHPKKIAFLFSAMRHFAQELRAAGHTVRYVTLDDEKNTGSLPGEIKRAMMETGAKKLIATEPGETRVLAMLKSLSAEIRLDTRFLCSISDFKAWAGDKKQLRMEYFYREMRKRYAILMDGEKPTGGKWNYDAENRKSPPKGMKSPARLSHPKSAITREVLALVKQRFSKNFGDIEPFHFATTRKEALLEAEHFITHLLPHFGDYQDAMVQDEAHLYHSLLSAYLNAGLLLPLELCQMAERAYREKKAPLNAAEGFIRQILGWREYVRGLYWRHPNYPEMNALGASAPLPALYWGAKTQMNCLAQAVKHTKEHAYSHHIQRLMLTGNFALLAGLSPHEVHEWYLAVYADAYEWVEAPNTIGMALHADDGIMASKPYAASGKYIQRMSNYCQNCYYDPAETTTPRACPFNALYWDFLARHESRFRPNHRMPYVYATWDKFGEENQAAIRAHAAASLKKLEKNEL